MSKCVECGATLMSNAKFCIECGTKVVQKTRKRTKKTGSTKSTRSRTRSSKKKSSSGKWATIIAVMLIGAGAWYWWTGDSVPDYSAYVEENFQDDYVPPIDKEIKHNNPEIERARKEFLEAYEKYTELVTTDKEGDVASALQDYKRKYQRYKQLESGAVNSTDDYQSIPDGFDGVDGVDGISDIDMVVDGGFFKEDKIGGKIVNEGNTVLDIPGEISVKIETGTFNPGNKALQIHSAKSELVNGRFYDLELENAPAIFNKPVEIEIPLQPGDNPKDFVAIDEVSEEVWLVVPSEYDKNSHSIKFNTQHFSVKGIMNYAKAKISGIGTRELRHEFGKAVGMVATGGVMVLLVGSVPVTLKVGAILYLGGIVLNTTGISRVVSDPLADKIVKGLYTDLNTSLKLSDELTVTWVDDPKSKSHLAGERISVCKNKITGKIEFIFFENMSGEHQELAKKIVKHSPAHEIVRLPISVLNLVAEMKLVKNYYKEKGYKVPSHTEIWIYDHHEAGAWNGSTLEIDVNYIKGKSDNVAASRLLTLSHEYWHSVYDENNYNPNYKWLNECFATSFEGQVSPSSGLWYTKGIIPESEQFYTSYPADKVAESMRTGFIYYGKRGDDADLVKRGYNLWPWGKYLLANQGHPEIQQLLDGEISKELYSAYFKKFCKSMLISDFAIEPFIEEDIDFAGVPVTYETPSGWHTLNPEQLFGNASLQLGHSKEYQNKGYFITPVPQSMYVGGFYPKPSAHKAPLVVRRIIPDQREEYLIFPASARKDKYGRYNYEDVYNDVGSAILPGKHTSGENVASMFAVINSSVEHSTKEYFSYEENPIIAYYLRKPRLVEMNEVQGKMELRWSAPELDKGLEEKDFLKGYNIYLKDKTSVILFNSVGLAEKKLGISHSQLSGYSEIGVATIDKEMKGKKGKPLTSEIQWIPIKSIGGKWVKAKESFSYLFDDKQGTETSAKHSNYLSSYSYKIGSGFAETSNSNNGRNTVDIETASFTHTWSSIPGTLVPGKQIHQKISVTNNGSSGKNAFTLYGNTKISIYNAKVEQEVKAGGALMKGMSWDDNSELSFNWTIPKPDQLTLSNPSKYPMKIFIEVSSSSNNSTKGFCTIEYVYRE